MTKLRPETSADAEAVAALHARAWQEGYAGILPDDLLAGSELPAEQEVSGAERRRAVQEVVEQMPDHLREVLVLAYFHRFPYQEMADVLGVPLGTIKSRLHAAVGHFAQRYKAAVGTGGGTAGQLEQEALEEP